MRRIAFLVMVLGLFIMLSYFFLGEKSVLDYHELSKRELNEKVFIKGEVVSERTLSGNRNLLQLNNGIEILCLCDKSFIDKNVSVRGYVSLYKDKKQVTALEIYS